MADASIIRENENKLQYRLRVLRLADPQKLLKVAEFASSRTGKPKAYHIADMVHCLRKFGAGYWDYQIFQMFNLSDAQRDTYLTRFRSKKLISQFNDSINYGHFFDNKDEFNVLFKDFIGRESLDMQNATKEDVVNYFQSREKIFLKMRDLTCGRGAELVYTKDFDSPDVFYKYVTEKGFGTLEDVIENHPDMAAVYPYAVNCDRMITMIGDDGEPHLLYCCQKFGNNGRIVDNYGMQSPVDLETGKLMYPAHAGDTAADVFYEKHPYSGVKFVGFQLPYFEEAKKMVLEAAKVVPQMRYIGWDVATTPNGPAIIEGNNYCAHDFWQLPGQTPNGIGVMPLLKKVVPSFHY